MPPGRRYNGKYHVEAGKITKNPFNRGSSDIATLRRVFSNITTSGPAIISGSKSGVVIIDVDYTYGGKESAEKLNLPETLTVISGRGKHYYFKHPGKDIFIPSLFEQWPGIDIRGDGVRTKLPPGYHSNGTVYRWVDWNMPIAPLPDSILEQIIGKPSDESLAMKFLWDLKAAYIDPVLYRIACWLAVLFNPGKEVFVES